MARLKKRRDSNFLSCIFKYSRKSGVLSRLNYLCGGLTAGSKPRGDASLTCQPHTGKIIFIPRNEVRFGGWGLARENSQPGVFFPVQQEVKQKISAPELHKFFIITECGQGCQDQHPTWDRKQSSFIRERKGIPAFSWEKKKTKNGLLLAFLVGSAWQELKDPFPEWWRVWVCCKNQSRSNRKFSNVLS